MSQKTENDRAKLRAERKERALPWSLSPFEHSCTETCGILEEGEVHVKAPEEVPFVGKCKSNWRDHRSLIDRPIVM